MRRVTVVLAGLVLALAGCGGEPVGTDVAGTWVLASGTGPDGAVEVPPDARVDLRFDDGQVGGVAACNSYGGEVAIDGDTITVGALSQTEMACDEPRMAAESAYLAALGRVATVARDGDTLTLTGPDVELVFELEPPEPDAALDGTTWTLDTVLDGDTASTVLGEPATLVLDQDGTFLAGTGCRAATGQWSRDGETLATADVGVDDVECDPDVTAQDDHVLAVLEASPSIAIDGARLTLMAGDRGLGYTTTPST